MGIVLLVGDRAFSSWSMRARVIAIEKRVPFTEIEVGLDWPLRFTDSGIEGISEYEISAEPCTACGCEQTQLLRFDTPARLLATSPVRIIPRVPVLLDTEQGAVVYDALAIAEYLDDAFPTEPLLMGSTLRARAEIRSLAAHIHGDYLPLMSGMSFAQSLRDGPRPTPPSTALDQMERLCSVLDDVLARAVGEFAFGAFSVVDAFASPFAQQARGWGILPRQPRVLAYFERLLHRDSVSQHLDEARRPYERIRQALPGSPAWIVSHYRHFQAANLIHNWQEDVYHVLSNEVACRAFELASGGSPLSAIIAQVAEEFDGPIDQIRQDVVAFFDALTPGRQYPTRNPLLDIE